MPKIERFSTNHFLSNISKTDAPRLSALMSLNTFEFNKVLSEPGEVVGAVLFPVGAVLSIINLMQDGRSVESSTIGREGAFGC